jgi:hypothetical protein
MSMMVGTTPEEWRGGFPASLETEESVSGDPRARNRTPITHKKIAPPGIALTQIFPTLHGR